MQYDKNITNKNPYIKVKYLTNDENFRQENRQEYEKKIAKRTTNIAK